MYNKINKIHMIGVGGIGMSGIAELLHRNGYQVSGSDLKGSDTLKNLETLGVRVFVGHHQENLGDAQLVVYSAAVHPENPELVLAKKNQIPVIPRAEMLAEIMRLKYGVAVAGAHGKTTTTSMIGLVLMEGGLDPTIVVGGKMDNFGGSNTRQGTGDFMVVEADESDGSFNQLSPSIAVVTNVDREHMDHYKNMATLKKAFVSFLNKVPFYGLCVACGDDPYLKVLLTQVSRRKKTYGFNEGNDYRLEHYSSAGEHTVSIHGQKETLRLQVPGKHNALNALATLAVADELGVPRAKIFAALASFQGVQRRFQKRGELNGVLLIDDYAHHPTEIKATLSAAKERFPKNKVRVVFQPHRYSRVEDLMDQFIGCFKKCDAVAITDIYSAGEMPIPGVHASIISEGITQDGTISHYIPTPLDAVKKMLADSRPGDVLITLGAGDLPHVYKQLL